MKIRLASRVLLAFILLSGLGPAQAAEPLAMAAFVGPPLHRPDRSGVLDRLAIEAFRRAGREIRIVRLPPRRSFVMLKRGEIDGLVMAGPDIVTRVRPVAAVIEEPITAIEVVVLSKRVRSRPPGLDWMRRYSAAYVRGLGAMKRYAAGAGTVFAVNSFEQAMDMLEAGRVDLVISGRGAVTRNAAHALTKNARVLEPPLGREELRMVLHRKYAALAPKVSRALKAMRLDGTTARLVRKGFAGGTPTE